MLIFQREITINTTGANFTDITHEVQKIVDQSNIKTGCCIIFIRHTSASLVIQENADRAVLRDLNHWLSDLAPTERDWEHNDEGVDDMPAHARAAITRTSENIPIANGRLTLGTWQGLYLWEHRRRPHQRQLVIHITGI
ncbi:MAG: YjbQ family protein [Deltaproteobacteria bacterium]|nr:YjbQ family protein [Deltaproteobacteria bacterium]